MTILCHASGVRTRHRLGSHVGPLPTPCEPADELVRALHRVQEPVYVVAGESGPAFSVDGEARLHFGSAADSPHPTPHRGDEGHQARSLLGFAEPVALEALGDPSFRDQHRLRMNYVVGAMANGIASVELVARASEAGLLAFFGAGGLSYHRVEEAISRLRSRLLEDRWGSNLIHSPAEPDLEDSVSRLYVRTAVPAISASAYLRLTLPIVRCRLAGLRLDSQGRPTAGREVLAKVSRVEVAKQFWSPAPSAMIDALRDEGTLDERQAEWARQIPVARDITVEADSGGHTDNRPAIALLPTFAALRDRLQEDHGYEDRLRFGAAGGISTPTSVLAAFEMGAAYVLTGSVNQGCLEAGTSDAVRRLLAAAEQADVAMAPAADMFEMGVKLQVLKRGTMFAPRAQKLWELYRNHASLEDIPAEDLAKVERSIFRCSTHEIWEQTRAFWADRDPKLLTRAEAEPKLKMALVFRWYLGMSSRWANSGEAERVADYQIWCGPAMGAFNEWVRGSYLEDWRERRVEDIALNMMHGAAVRLRVNQLRRQGLSFSIRVQPQRLEELERVLL